MKSIFVISAVEKFTVLVTYGGYMRYSVSEQRKKEPRMSVLVKNH